MPEGDTVWQTARLLERRLAGRVLTGSDFRVPGLATVDLTGWTVRESTCRGKHLLLRLAAAPDPGSRLFTLHSHLRMDGTWRVHAPGERWTARPAHLIRVVLETAGAVAVGYHLHDLDLSPTADEHLVVGHLGPDILGSDWDEAEAVRRLRGRPGTTVAEALLDQRNLAGIGNVYKAEALFLRGVWPWTPVGNVGDLPALVRLARRLLLANRDRPVRSTTGSLRRGETSHVYGRAGSPCRRCGTAIRSESTGDRVTYWCPHCQPPP
ncbi:putative endonuclease 8 2 [Longispora fulva]|uniref:DNA-(apurinic or apyrimidinic site) lyase n=1 Tax=Longispora fulva TaxID=619741 RepID=A0A8J7GFM9_9ACTN|nr:Fpg/Nei family DNA glycosylase [Longispora fulva]MBG6135068.1 endonuclease-8 [Longispora fulva]GIG56697.1 putative endonuclease 8 2 [Longispora fulva]